MCKPLKLVTKLNDCNPVFTNSVVTSSHSFVILFISSFSVLAIFKDFGLNSLTILGMNVSSGVAGNSSLVIVFGESSLITFCNCCQISPFSEFSKP